MNNMLKMDGYDECIIGIVERCGQEPFYVYDTDLVIENLMSQGMTEEAAIEFHEYNQVGAWLGEGTPGFLRAYTED
jgi:hypothetical protein